jgi:hypothetical protein
MRNVALAQLLADPVDGIFIAEYEQTASATPYSASSATWAWKALARNT